MARELLTVSRLLIILFLIEAANLCAQEPDDVITHLKSGQTVRVRMHEGGLLESSIVAIEGVPLSLQLADPDTLVTIAEIDSLWVRGSAWKTGAFVGAAALGVSGLLLMGSVCETFSGSASEPPCGDKGGLYVASATMAGGAVGALLGTAIGSVVPKWRLVHARRD